MRKPSLIPFGTLVLAAFCAGVLPASGQAGDSDQQAPSSSSSYSSAAGAAPIRASSTNPSQTSITPFSTVGIGVNLSLLGVGVEAATPLSMRTNLRVGFHDLGYSDTFTSDGISYAATLTLRSVDTLLDWYPFKGSFHISPGALIYNGNQIKANASVAGGGYFTLNSVSYVSSAATPVTGTGSLKFNAAAPMVLAGWGNLVPRTKHFSFPFEAGVVFQGSPKATLNLNGDVCNNDGYGVTDCRAISSDPTVMANVKAQQAKLSNDVSAFKYYPVIQLGFAYKF